MTDYEYDENLPYVVAERDYLIARFANGGMARDFAEKRLYGRPFEVIDTTPKPRVPIETVEQARDRLMPQVLAYARMEGLSEVGIASAALRIGITDARAVFEKAHATPEPQGEPTDAQDTEEPEWEYGVHLGLSSEVRLHSSRKLAVADARATSTLTHLDGSVDEFDRTLMRRRKAGPWESVPAAENNEREKKP